MLPSAAKRVSATTQWNACTAGTRTVARFGAGFRGNASIAHAQRWTSTRPLGRRLSSSYTPRAGQPRHDVVLAALHEPFDAMQRDGHVSMDNDARIFVGTPVPS